MLARWSWSFPDSELRPVQRTKRGFRSLLGTISPELVITPDAATLVIPAPALRSPHTMMIEGDGKSGMHGYGIRLFGRNDSLTPTSRIGAAGAKIHTRDGAGRGASAGVPRLPWASLRKRASGAIMTQQKRRENWGTP
jgi:hypothetical protein